MLYYTKIDNKPHKAHHKTSVTSTGSYMYLQHMQLKIKHPHKVNISNCPTPQHKTPLSSTGRHAHASAYPKLQLPQHNQNGGVRSYKDDSNHTKQKTTQKYTTRTQWPAPVGACIRNTCTRNQPKVNTYKCPTPQNISVQHRQACTCTCIPKNHITKVNTRQSTNTFQMPMSKCPQPYETLRDNIYQLNRDDVHKISWMHSWVCPIDSPAAIA